MDNTAIKAAWAEIYAWLKSVPGLLWANLVASSIKTKGVIAVVVAIAGMWGFDKLPSRADVASTIPNYATSAEVKSVQSGIDEMTAELHQMRIELNAVEAKLSEPPPITTGSVSKSKRK